VRNETAQILRGQISTSRTSSMSDIDTPATANLPLRVCAFRNSRPTGTARCVGRGLVNTGISRSERSLVPEGRP
jgi:hypothetical protein